MRAPQVPGVESSLAGQQVGGAAQHGATLQDDAAEAVADRSLADWLRNENDPRRSRPCFDTFQRQRSPIATMPAARSGFRNLRCQS